MTRARDWRRYPTLTDAQFRGLFRPENLPSQPWRYTLTPTLVLNLTRVADAAGQMRASPISYCRRKELAASAKRMRILWNVSQLHGSVTHEQIEAVLKGARLVDRRGQPEKPSRVRHSSRMGSRTSRRPARATDGSGPRWRWSTGSAARGSRHPVCPHRRAPGEAPRPTGSSIHLASAPSSSSCRGKPREPSPR